jgi:hypothetical protein
MSRSVCLSFIGFSLLALVAMHVVLRRPIVETMSPFRVGRGYGSVGDQSQDFGSSRA